ncbi:MAG: hypothetical protein AB7I50_05470 [Vicinamibacterales bacterium]
MFELKPLSKAAIPAALAKAERYRLLNQPMSAASICEDILHVDPDRHDALVTWILALTELFSESNTTTVLSQAQDLVHRLPTDYERAYYSGIICERRGWALLSHATPGAGVLAYDWLRDAMRCYERAESMRPADNDDAILRWNTCARLLMQHPQLHERVDEPHMPFTLE